MLVRIFAALIFTAVFASSLVYEAIWRDSISFLLALNAWLDNTTIAVRDLIRLSVQISLICGAVYHLSLWYDEQFGAGDQSSD